MRRLMLCMAIVLTISSVQAQDVIINEFLNASDNGEWVELLVVTDSLDLRGWDVRDFSAAGAAQTPLTFSTNVFWSNVRQGTIIVVARQEFTVTEDLDPADRLLIIRSGNATYFSGTPFLISGTSEALQIRNSSDVHVAGISYGSANASSIPSPKVHLSSGPATSASVAFTGNSLVQFTSIASWNSSNIAPTPGAGNSPSNTGWINTLRASGTGDGSGTASVSPDTLEHGSIYSLAITFRRSVPLSDMRVILPSFQWSKQVSDLSYTNMTATASISGDTINFHSMTMSQDSTVITIHTISPPQNTGTYPIDIQTKASSLYLSIAELPKVTVFGIPEPIAYIKANDVAGVPLRLGGLATLRGVVTVSNQFGGPSFVQDNSGGMAIFSSAFSTNVTLGDEVVVSGTVSQFNGLTELTSPILHEVVSTGNIIEPLVVNCQQVFSDGGGGMELYEGMLVRLAGVVVRDTSNQPIGSWVVSGSGSNYRLIDGTGVVDVRVDNSVNFANSPAPQAQFDVIGVVSQFKTSTPFTSGYQVMPRSGADILTGGPIIIQQPCESNITSTSLRIGWMTLFSGSSRVRYGLTTSYEIGIVVPDNLLRTTHDVGIHGLQPATMYHMQVFSVDSSGDTSVAGDLLVSTASPLGSTGTINVYFNKSTYSGVSSGEVALSNQDLIARLVGRINAARRSIDVSLYSMSANNQGDIVANALIAAKNRGVKVRVICEADNQNAGGSSFPMLVAAGVPLINDRYDQVWDGEGFMHDKFFVFDYRGGAPESVWVWTGSWNPSFQGTTSDRQNAVEIQDVALAGGYTVEFNEMWGSSNETPNQTASRFGGRKSDNTPHYYRVNGTEIELRFSPSDGTTRTIGRTLSRAAKSVSAALFGFTRRDLADSIILRKNNGAKTRVLMDNNGDTGNQFSYLQTNGIDIRLKGGTGLLHHKYALVDADQTGGTQYTITGSHNWSNSAENSNDENTLIIKSNRITNLYLQEFAARYYEAGGTDSIILAGSPVASISPNALSFDSVMVGASRIDSFTVANVGSAPLSVSSAVATQPQFSVSPSMATIPPPASQTFYVTFHPQTVGEYSAYVVLNHNATSAPDTIHLAGIGTSPIGQVSIPVGISEGWNLVSLPLYPSNNHIAAIFPAANLGSLYGYENGYQRTDSLAVGSGYWLKSDTMVAETISGTAALSKNIPVKARWNLIGSLSVAVPVGAIQPQSTSLTSLFFGYENGYVVADTLLPGKGYWIKVSLDGQLAVNEGDVGMRPQPVRPNMSQNSWIEFSDGSTARQKLYIIPPDHIFPEWDKLYELPPSVPAGDLDVRSDRGTMVISNSNLQRNGEVISIKSRFDTVFVSWSIDSQDRNVYTLSTESVNSFIRMKGNGTARIPFKDQYVLGASPFERGRVPEQFELRQNYPNPFNPITTIAFDVPIQSTVTVALYSVLGELVEVLIENQIYDAGFYSIEFDGKSLASGIYYCRLIANDLKTGRTFVAARKLLLVK